MADKDYRSFQGRVYAGPYDREVTTQGVVKTVYEYMLSGPGLNGDIEIKASFWNGDPGLNVKELLFISGKFSTYEGKDKNGDAKITKTINVNYAFRITGEELNVADNSNKGKPAPKKRPVQDDSDDLGF